MQTLHRVPILTVMEFWTKTSHYYSLCRISERESVTAQLPMNQDGTTTDVEIARIIEKVMVAAALVLVVGIPALFILGINLVLFYFSIPISPVLHSVAHGGLSGSSSTLICDHVLAPFLFMF